MDQTGLPSNSLMNQREEGPKIEDLKVVPVVSGKVVKSKKSLGRKFVDTFINEDVDDVPLYLKKNVLVPMVKRTVVDIITLLFGRGTSNYNSSELRNTPYHRMGTGLGSVYLMGSSTMPTSSTSEINRKTFNDLHYDNGADGKIVKENIEQIFEMYRKVRVADVLELSGMSDLIEYPDNNYGWTDIRAMQLIYDGSGGATLKMPPAHPL